VSSHLLSKTSFLKAVQCDKSFFLYKNHYDLKDPLSPEKLSVFNRGHKVGILAQELFPGGVDVSPTHAFKFSEAIEKTKELIAQGQEVIYEATFVYDDTLVAIDILAKRDDKWYAYEVKSSLKISQTYVMDAALQYYVIKNALPSLEDISLVTLNDKYRLQEKIDVHGLFRIKSVKKDAEKNIDFIRYHIQRAKEIHERNQLPEVKIGGHCFYPYNCDFMGICWKHIPANSVYELSGTSKQQLQEWYEMGYKTIEEIPEHLPTGNMRAMIEAYKKGTELIEREKINSLLKKITYPLAFLDMEFYTPAVPKYPGSAPFELNPFLFSWLSLTDENASPVSDYFFHEENTRPELTLYKAWLRKRKK
jgi:cytochrome c-type biogenesis protein CcmE